MEIKEVELYVKDLSTYSAADIRDLEFMTDEELDNYQFELERDSGNLSDWDHCRAILTFRRKEAELKRLQKELYTLRNSGLYASAEETYEALPRVCEAILNGEEWSI